MNKNSGAAASAAILQQRLMAYQPECPYAEWAVRMNPAESISGDLVLTWNSGAENHLHCLVGDVVGHGAQAALIGVLAAAFLMRQHDLDCDQRLRALNEFLCTNAEDDLFLTALITRLDAGGHLQIASAGHPCAILLRADGNYELLPKTWGPPAGMFAGQHDYTPEPTRLRPYDRLLLLSDGLLERPQASADASTIPMPVLAEILRASQIDSLEASADTIWTMLTALCRSRTHPDDQSMLLLQYRG